ncbi:MAG TPA: acetoacetate decarboxylase family protein [Acidimicrobiales bacterium]|nr:acetoacetate decarboxylase family protein [Acidimicrobiales bacterium]
MGPRPWRLTGECIVGLARGGGGRKALPADIESLPGPRLVLGAQYDESPVGPYRELAVAEPARLGTRVGMCVTTMVVTTAESRRAGRANWGLPKELGTLEWLHDGDARVLRWLERDVVLRATPVGLPLPALVPFRTLQRRADGPVSALARVRGLARPAKLEVTVPDHDPLSWLAGGHLGTVVSSARLVMGEACPPETAAVLRRAARRASRSAPEPALSSVSHPGD